MVQKVKWPLGTPTFHTKILPLLLIHLPSNKPQGLMTQAHGNLGKTGMEFLALGFGPGQSLPYLGSDQIDEYAHVCSLSPSLPPCHSAFQIKKLQKERVHKGTSKSLCKKRNQGLFQYILKSVNTMLF